MYGKDRQNIIGQNGNDGLHYKVCKDCEHSNFKVKEYMLSCSKRKKVTFIDSTCDDYKERESK